MLRHAVNFNELHEMTNLRHILHIYESSSTRLLTSLLLMC